jgi:hypothetical protein
MYTIASAIVGSLRTSTAPTGSWTSQAPMDRLASRGPTRDNIRQGRQLSRWAAARRGGGLAHGALPALLLGSLGRPTALTLLGVHLIRGATQLPLGPAWKPAGSLQGWGPGPGPPPPCVWPRHLRDRGSCPGQCSGRCGWLPRRRRPPWPGITPVRSAAAADRRDRS